MGFKRRRKMTVGHVARRLRPFQIQWSPAEYANGSLHALGHGGGFMFVVANEGDDTEDRPWRLRVWRKGREHIRLEAEAVSAPHGKRLAGAAARALAAFMPKEIGRTGTLRG